jgi:hypothetical protein
MAQIVTRRRGEICYRRISAASAEKSSPARPAPMAASCYSSSVRGDPGPTRFEGMTCSLTIPARARRGARASMHVSKDWAVWLSRHRDRLQHISIPTASRFVQLTADFVRSFAELGELMRIYTEPAAFEGALSHAIANAARP